MSTTLSFFSSASWSFLELMKMFFQHSLHTVDNKNDERVSVETPFTALIVTNLNGDGWSDQKADGTFFTDLWLLLWVFRRNKNNPARNFQTNHNLWD